MKVSLNYLHHQTNDWIREGNFFKDELKVLSKRLEEVARANTSADVLAQVEHFQNKFIVYKEQLDILLHNLHQSETDIQSHIKTRPEHTHEKFMDTNDTLQQNMKEYANGFSGLRLEFNKFLSQTF